MSEPVPAAEPVEVVPASAANESATPVVPTAVQDAQSPDVADDAPDSPEAGSPEAEMSDVAPAHTGVTNESPVLPPNAAAGAAKAHALLTHLVTAAQALQAELERYVPADAISAAEVEVKSMLRDIL